MTLYLVYPLRVVSQETLLTSIFKHSYYELKQFLEIYMIIDNDDIRYLLHSCEMKLVLELNQAQSQSESVPLPVKQSRVHRS